jgi:hypothetical protein
MRGAPQSGFASDIVRINVRMPSGRVGRPRCRLFHGPEQADNDKFKTANENDVFSKNNLSYGRDRGIFILKARLDAPLRSDGTNRYRS